MGRGWDLEGDGMVGAACVCGWGVKEARGGKERSFWEDEDGMKRKMALVVLWGKEGREAGAELGVGGKRRWVQNFQ